MESKFGFYALKLCFVLVVVFVLQVIFSGLTDLLLLSSSSIFEVWRFVTAIFVHGGLAHLLYNLLALALFGSMLETFIGGKRFFLVFIVTGILANVLAVLFYPASLGASGAIFGVIGALIVLRPLMVVWAFGMPMPLILAGALWITGDIIGAAGYLLGNPIDSTGNIAHLSGAAFGFIFGFYYRLRKRGTSKKYTSVKKDLIPEAVITRWEKENWNL